MHIEREKQILIIFRQYDLKFEKSQIIKNRTNKEFSKMTK